MRPAAEGYSCWLERPPSRFCIALEELATVESICDFNENVLEHWWIGHHVAKVTVGVENVNLGRPRCEKSQTFDGFVNDPILFGLKLTGGLTRHCQVVKHDVGGRNVARYCDN